MARSLPTIPDASTTSGRRGIVYTLTTLVLTAIVAVVVLDGADVVDAVGVDTETETVVGEGYELTVRAATVSRPALATPFEIRVRRPAGFDEPVAVGIETSYLALFDYQRMYPEPSSERTHGELTVLEFDPPDGDELVVSFDWRLEPAVQQGRRGTVAVLDGDQVAVALTTDLQVRP